MKTEIHILFLLLVDVFLFTSSLRASTVISKDMEKIVE